MEYLIQALSVIGIVYTDPSKPTVSKPEEIEEEKQRPKSIRPALPYVYVEDPLKWTKSSVGTITDLHTGKSSLLYISLRPRCTLYIGISEAGKTTCMRARHRAFAKEKYFKFGLAMSPTAQRSGDLNWIPKREIKEPDAELLCVHIIRLKALGDYYAANKWGRPPANFLILDDTTKILGSNKTASDLFQNFVTIARHSNTSIDANFHELTGAFPLLRKNSKHVHQYQTTDRREVDSMFNAFCLYLPPHLQSAKAYRAWVAQNILNFQALLFINEGPAPKYYLFKAHEVQKGSFKIYNEKPRIGAET
jgi:hypothetical protein